MHYLCYGAARIGRPKELIEVLSRRFAAPRGSPITGRGRVRILLVRFTLVGSSRSTLNVRPFSGEVSQRGELYIAQIVLHLSRWCPSFFDHFVDLRLAFVPIAMALFMPTTREVCGCIGTANNSYVTIDISITPT